MQTHELEHNINNINGLFIMESVIWKFRRVKTHGASTDDFVDTYSKQVRWVFRPDDPDRT
jgi:hypothetical protein